MDTSSMCRSCRGGILVIPAKNWSYLFFTFRMSSSSLSSSVSCLITYQRIQYAHLRDSTSLRSIPSVERILSSQGFSSLIAEFGRATVKDAVVDHLEGLRSGARRFEEEAAVGAIRAALRTATAATLRPVINGSGVIIPTNLGRCPIDPALWERAGAIAERYSNLEFDLESGQRGARDQHLE